MGRIGIIKHEDYSSEKLDRIFHIIENTKKTGGQQFYEVFLDDMRIIPRTSDPELLNTFTEFVNSDSKKLTIYLYYGASKHSDTYNFYFRGVPTNKVKPQDLSGVSMDELEKQQRDKILKEIHHENLEKENTELKLRVEELEEELVKQQEHFEKAKSDKFGSLGEIGSAILLKTITNPLVLKRLPFLQGLAGLGDVPKETAKDNKEEKPEEVATFKAKGEKNEEDATVKSELSETDQGILRLFNHVTKNLDEKQTETLFEMLIRLGKNPHAIKRTNKLLEEFIKNKPPQNSKAA